MKHLLQILLIQPYGFPRGSYKLQFLNSMVTTMNLESIDLDLFLVLHTVIEERSATRAGARLHLSRPAISNALARLRRLLHDPLLVRSARGLVATPFTLEIAPHLSAAVQHLQSVMEATRRFDPAATTRRFTVACSDYEQMAFLPPVLREFRRRLPNATLRVVSVDQLVRANGLATGEVDLLVGAPPAPLPTALGAEVIGTDEIACIVRRDHPYGKGKVSIDRFFELAHVEVALLGDGPTTGRQMADSMAAKLGRTRRVALSVPTFASAAIAVIASDCVAAIPRRLAVTFSQFWPLRILPIPVEIPPITTQMIWHTRTAGDPPVEYLKRLIAEMAKRAPTGPRKRRGASTGAARPGPAAGVRPARP